MFTKRLSKDGLDGNNYWYSHSLNPFAQNDLWLPNCTNYAFGRSSEIANKNLRNDLSDSYPNAKEWYRVAKWKKGSTPKVGAIGVWGGNLGHVAIVEEIKGDNVLFSQSNYKRPINKNSSSYFETKLYKPVVGKVTSGVGLVFLGYIYNPYVDDKRINRDTANNQVEVLADLIRIRKAPNGEILKGLYCPKGLFNVLEFKEESGYVWTRLDNDLWIATNDKDGWTKTYLKSSDDIEELNKQIANLNSQIKALQGEKTKLEQEHLEEVNTLTSALNKSQSINKSCNQYAQLILNLTKEK